MTEKECQSITLGILLAAILFIGLPFGAGIYNEYRQIRQVEYDRLEVGTEYCIKRKYPYIDEYQTMMLVSKERNILLFALSMTFKEHGVIVDISRVIRPAIAKDK